MFGKVLLVILGLAICSFGEVSPIWMAVGWAVIFFGLFMKVDKKPQKQPGKGKKKSSGDSDPYTGRFHGDDTLGSFDREGNFTPSSDFHYDIDGGIHTPSGGTVDDDNGHYHEY